LSGAALVHVEHEQFSFTPSRRARLRRLAPLCHRVVVVGEDLKRFFVECVGLDPRRLVVINNGVEVDKYALGPSEERKDLGLPADGRLVGHVARLDPAKDQASLIQAFACARLTHQDIRLVIVGDGPSRARLERLADDLRVRDRVTFLGSRSDVPRLLTHFELFVLSSTQEGLPLALLEAMACGKPVVVTAVGEIPRIVEDGATGVLVPPGEPAALAGALVRLLRRPVEAEALGAAARALVRARYDLSATIRQYEALYVGLQRAAEAGR
jgi:glycosyltransferase involved in cell wall biosynthesis